MDWDKSPCQGRKPSLLRPSLRGVSANLKNIALGVWVRGFPLDIDHDCLSYVPIIILMCKYIALVMLIMTTLPGWLHPLIAIGLISEYTDLARISTSMDYHMMNVWRPWNMPMRRREIESHMSIPDVQIHHGKFSESCDISEELQ